MTTRQYHISPQRKSQFAYRVNADNADKYQEATLIKERQIARTKLNFAPSPDAGRLSRKRGRALADVEGANSSTQRKKRRLRFLPVTSRLSPPFSDPPSYIVDRGLSQIAFWAKQKSLGRNLLRKAAILNRIRRRVLPRNGSKRHEEVSLKEQHGLEEAKLAFIFTNDTKPVYSDFASLSPPTKVTKPLKEFRDREPEYGFTYTMRISNDESGPSLRLLESPLGLSNYDASDIEEGLADPYAYLDGEVSFISSVQVYSEQDIQLLNFCNEDSGYEGSIGEKSLSPRLFDEGGWKKLRASNPLYQNDTPNFRIKTPHMSIVSDCVQGANPIKTRHEEWDNDLVEHDRTTRFLHEQFGYHDETSEMRSFKLPNKLADARECSMIEWLDGVPTAHDPVVQRKEENNFQIEMNAFRTRVVHEASDGKFESEASDTLLGRIRHLVCNNYEILSTSKVTLAGGCDAGGSSAEFTGSSASRKSVSRSTSTGKTSVEHESWKRSRNGDSNDDGSEDSDDRRRKRQDRKTLPGPTGSPKRRLKCPYYQKSPVLYVKAACRGEGFVDMAKLKDHLKRVHSRPMKCVRCWEEMKSLDARDEHLQTDPICTKRAEPADDRIDLHRLRALSFNGGPFAGCKTVEAKWKTLFRILFPAEEVVPSPFYRSCTSVLFKKIFLRRLDAALLEEFVQPSHLLLRLYGDSEAETSRTSQEPSEEPSSPGGDEDDSPLGERSRHDLASRSQDNVVVLNGTDDLLGAPLPADFDWTFPSDISMWDPFE